MRSIKNTDRPWQSSQRHLEYSMTFPYNIFCMVNAASLCTVIDYLTGQSITPLSETIQEQKV